MRIALILMLSLFMHTLSAFAQQTSIGATVGSGSGWMTNSGEDLAYKQSYTVGATLIYSTSSHWGFGMDVKYSREGIKYNFQDSFLYTDKKMNTRVSTDFVRVPIRVIYFFNNNEYKIRPAISLGPSFGFLTGGKISIEDDEKNVYSKTNVSDQYKSFDFGVQGTLGLNFKLSEALWLSTDVAYYHGLLRQNIYGDNAMMNKNLMLNIGLRIGMK